jgi:hypothetical protein
MKVRPAASGLILHEVMEKVIELPTWVALMEHLKQNYEFWEPDEKNVTIHFYAEDKRIGWKTHLVCVKGNAALFTDGIPEDAPKENQRDPHAQLPAEER